jgi:hypothetical protein
MGICEKQVSKIGASYKQPFTNFSFYSHRASARWWSRRMSLFSRFHRAAATSLKRGVNETGTAKPTLRKENGQMPVHCPTPDL